jgi:hypothetical protein
MQSVRLALELIQLLCRTLSVTGLMQELRPQAQGLVRANDESPGVKRTHRLGLPLGEQQGNVPAVSTGGNCGVFQSPFIKVRRGGRKGQSGLLQQGFAGLALGCKDQHEAMFSTLSCTAQASTVIMTHDFGVIKFLFTLVAKALTVQLPHSFTACGDSYGDKCFGANAKPLPFDDGKIRIVDSGVAG